LKTHRTLIATPSGQIFASPVGNPGMATAGMGDVLTGVLTSLVGQSAAQEQCQESDITASLCLGVYIHGLAGNLAAEKIGHQSLVAGDVIEALGESFSRLAGF
jgi:NAD(P)H-hydrate epimerase